MRLFAAGSASSWKIVSLAPSGVSCSVNPRLAGRTGRDFSGDLEWTRVPDRKQVPQYQRVVRKR